MSASNNAHPELAKAEQRVAAAAATADKAQGVVVDLEKKRDAAVQHGTALADERAGVALAAHTGDDKAAKRLQEIHTAIAVHGSELASLDAAVRAAGEKVDAAKAAVTTAEQKVRAEKLRVVSRVFTTHMRKLDKHLGDFADELDNVEDIREQLGALGVGPSFEQLVVLGERPLHTVLSQSIFENRVGRHLQPHERTTFAQLAVAWTRQHEVEIARILGDQQTNDEAA
jgi:hypothetical protein